MCCHIDIFIHLFIHLFIHQRPDLIPPLVVRNWYKIDLAGGQDYTLQHD
jgi:hypothetical protein